MPNKFTSALKSRTEPAPARKSADAAGAEQGRGKHIGGYFDPVVSKQIRAIALEEALDMLFQSRNLPMIATRKNKKM